MLADVSTEATIFGVSNNTSTVTFVLIGLKQYFPSSTYGATARPFAKAGIGSFVGTQSGTLVRTVALVTVESRTEAVFGGQMGAGVDFVLGDRVLAEVSLGNDLMADFNRPIGGSANYSGP